MIQLPSDIVYGYPSDISTILEGSTVSPPVNVVLPHITGTEAVGQNLYVTPGSWANNPTAYSFQWKRNGVTNIGLNSTTYLIDIADVGSTISCVVTATNASGSGTATSNSTGVISGDIQENFSYPGYGEWTCPPGITLLKSVMCRGGGGAGAYAGMNNGGGGFTPGGGGGGGGGAVAIKYNVPVVPGNIYPYDVGTGANSNNASTPSLWNQSQVYAPGGNSATDVYGAPGGDSGLCIGDVAYSGGQGGQASQDGLGDESGGGGGAGAGLSNNGAGGSGTSGGSGVNGGGSGGNGGTLSTDGTGGSPYGGGGGGAGMGGFNTTNLGFGNDGNIVIVY